MPVKIFASVVVECEVYMKNKNMLPQIGVPFLGDVGAEVRVAAVGVFDGVPTQHAGYQRISIRLAIRD